MSHVCHAEGCNVPVRPSLLMCRRHWYMVPKPIRDWIWAAYRPGQEVTKDPSDEYMEAYRAAVGAVADAEGRYNPYRGGDK